MGFLLSSKNHRYSIHFDKECSMRRFSVKHGISTLLNHFEEGNNPLNAHMTPIYQTSTFSFPDVATGIAIERGEQDGFIYTRLGNPNAQQLARKLALLEGIDLIRAKPELPVDDIVAGQIFASGMSAVTSTILARASAGDTIIAQEALYGNVYNFLHDTAVRLGIHIVWVSDTSAAGWQAAFRDHPKAVLAYVETPVNPNMLVVDLKMVAELAHQHDCWLVADNTFATPYCQRPLNLGADLVVHSTTKYLSGHGVIIGGAVISPHLDFIHQDVQESLTLLGGVPSPFDTWLANLGLRTFELRMQRHCANALAIAHHLESHPKVAAVYYPGLESDPGHAIARKQMYCFGGMLSFELKGGLQAGETLMNSVRVATLAVSLGNLDTLIQHPASMTQSSVSPEERLRMGVSDGLVRLSVGIENVDDLLEDLEQALEQC